MRVLDHELLRTGMCHQQKQTNLLCIWQLGAAPFYKNYAQLYFDAKHLQKGLLRGW